MTPDQKPHEAQEDTRNSPTSSRVQHHDQEQSGILDTGEACDELRWARRHVPDDPVVTQRSKADFQPLQKAKPPGVVGKTKLRDLHCAPPRRSQRSIRKETKRDLLTPDPDVPYVEAERALCDLVCALIERQDRVTTALLLKINNLELRLDEVEGGDTLEERGS